MGARHREDPTLSSYLSSLFYLLSVPVLIGVAVGGYALGWYPYRLIVPVLAGLLVSIIVLAFAAMHVYSTR